MKLKIERKDSLAEYRHCRKFQDQLTNEGMLDLILFDADDKVFMRACDVVFYEVISDD